MANPVQSPNESIALLLTQAAKDHEREEGWAEEVMTELTEEYNRLAEQYDRCDKLIREMIMLYQRCGGGGGDRHDRSRSPHNFPPSGPPSGAAHHLLHHHHTLLHHHPTTSDKIKKK